MKYLSKIYFINSANIPYGQINLDGNVHFTGTQGVGKSTLLRAILFFYTADSLKLGIRQNQDKFERFYFPGPESYIAYEVARDDDRPFTILTNTNHGHIVYHFIDAPFDIAWLRDNQGLVTPNFSDIRVRIGKGIAVSKIINSFTEYRNIIYGNNPSADYSRYALMHSSHYNNLRRIIQNVFLNERVDADFIKKTIIQSIDEDSEPALNLSFFRNQLAHFTEEYNDVLLWFTTDRHNRCIVRDQADTVIGHYHTIENLTQEISRSCRQLNYAIRKAEIEIPQLRNKISQLRQHIAKSQSDISYLSDKYNDDRDKLICKRAVVEDRLRKAETCRRHYIGININEILKLDLQELALVDTRERIKADIATLEKTFGNIVDAYNARMDQLKANFDTYQMGRQAEIDSIATEYNQWYRSLLDERDRAIKQEAKRLDDEADRLGAERQSLADQINELKLKIIRVDAAAPFAQQIESINALVDELRQEQHKLEVSLRDSDKQIAGLEKECEIELIQARNVLDAKQKSFVEQLKELDASIDDDEALLNSFDGSLCQWLEANMPGWESNIGRIAHERAVLYNTSLSPAMAEESSSFYGINIDLSQLEQRIRSPKEIRHDLDALRAKRATVAHDLEQTARQGQAAIDEITERYNRRLRDARNQRGIHSAALRNIPLKIEEAKVNLEKWQKKQREQIDANRAPIIKERDKAIVDLADKDKEIAAFRKSKENAMRRLHKQADDANKQRRNADDLRISEIRAEIASQKAKLKADLMQLEDQCDSELADNGVDKSLRAQRRAELRSVEDLLNKINSNKNTVFEYNKDKRELLDRVDEFKREQRTIEEKLNNLESSYRQKLARLQEQLDKQSAQLKALERTLDDMEQGLEDATFFFNSPAYPDFADRSAEEKSTRSCAGLHSSVITDLASRSQAVNCLKKAVNDFRKNFSPCNTFKFLTDFDTDEDFMNYAANLDDFVANDKITEFTRQTNKIYTDLIRRVAVEYGKLIDKESNINKIIHEINTDFAHKGFAGVIRSIELKLNRNQSSSIIQQIDEIYNYYSLNPFDNGEVNLFSDDKETEAAKRQSIKHLQRLAKILDDHNDVEDIKLSDTFALKIKIEENNNSTGWVDNIRSVGSDGTDILVKAIINILLINVFKKQISRKKGDFRVHCMMDEIGKLAEENVRGILDFAGSRNIYVVNSSPAVNNPLDYSYLYLIKKDDAARTHICQLLTTIPAASSDETDS